MYYESERVIGMSCYEANMYIENHDLWDEVVEIICDNNGIVIRVIH